LLDRSCARQGTIVEWTVKVGDSVKTDDVVALVETDKVTVELKADSDGVIVQQFGEVYVVGGYALVFYLGCVI
jgi:2-oxoglutarate dehydrogenase E2 component (dihydrolipoamide succinyltransferase)